MLSNSLCRSLSDRRSSMSVNSSIRVLLAGSWSDTDRCSTSREESTNLRSSPRTSDLVLLTEEVNCHVGNLMQSRKQHWENTLRSDCKRRRPLGPGSQRLRRWRRVQRYSTALEIVSFGTTPKQLGYSSYGYYTRRSEGGRAHGDGGEIDVGNLQQREWLRSPLMLYNFPGSPGRERTPP